MLRDPRSWLAKDELRFIPLEAPLNALFVLGLGLLETSRLEEIRSPPLGRFCGLCEGALPRSLADGRCLSLAAGLCLSLADGLCLSLAGS